jgi:hypothetical protein
MPNSPRKRYVLIKFVLIITPNTNIGGKCTGSLWRNTRRKQEQILLLIHFCGHGRVNTNTVVHQCQLLDRIAEKGQVWIKWTSTGKIGCIPKSNIEEPKRCG